MSTTRNKEEPINALTHGVGVVLSIVALVALVVQASLAGGATRIVAVTLFGVSLVLLYTASTCYHSVRCPRMRKMFRRLDHAAIYLLIAGTYTPFTLLNLRGGWGWTLFGIVWGLAAIGVIFKTFYTGRFEVLSTAAYVLMGWLVVIAVKPTMETVEPAGLAWLVAGGLAYTFGVIFYAMRRMPYNHAVWHLFVLTGSVCHFFAVFHYARP